MKISALFCVASSVLHPRRIAQHRPLAACTLRMQVTENEQDEEMLQYWQQHESKWQRPLQMLDVCAAWGCGELDGILPSGRASRAKTSERLLTLARAVELFEADDVDINVRRRYRSLRIDELRPRWTRIVATRSRLQASQDWETVVEDSDKARAYERALVMGEVEDEDASPAASRAVATLLKPALKAAAEQRSRADGGIRRAYANLCHEAGKDAAERWMTAALLADIENEVADLASTSDGEAAAAIATAAAPSGFDFAAREAERDLETANFSGLLGVGLAIVSGLIFIVDWPAVLSAPGEFSWSPVDSRSGIEKALDLMQ